MSVSPSAPNCVDAGCDGYLYHEHDPTITANLAANYDPTIYKNGIEIVAGNGECVMISGTWGHIGRSTKNSNPVMTSSAGPVPRVVQTTGSVHPQLATLPNC